MDYKLKAGTLYAAGKNAPLASIRTVFGESTNNIFGPAGELVAHTEVRVRGDLNGQEQGVEKKEYVLYDRDQSECAVARPAYCEEDAPNVAGWPVCRTPRADHARFCMAGRDCVLQMHDERHYSLQTSEGLLVEMTHRGVLGGWDLRVSAGFSAVLLCGLFAFCRYLERENEFPTV